MVNVSEFSYGYVVGQLVLAKSDGDDLDRLPDFLGQNAKVTFTRIQGQYVQPVKSVRSGIRALMVSHQPVVAGLMSDGTITGDVDSNAELKPDAKPGLWLVVGRYNVNFGDAFPSTTIEVKESHTEDDPLDIASAIGYKPAPNHVVTTVELPRGGEPGQVYGWTGTGIGWYTPPAGDSAYDLAVRNGFVGSEAEWVQSLKGDDGEPGHWTKDQQAKAQGYWIVVSPTEPESGTYTTADGTVVPVVWQKPIEVMVPVIPEAPYFDKYALSIQVASLVGVDYYLTGFTKDGATVDVPDVKVPDGGILKLADVSGKPALPYTVNVEARAEPGYLLPNALKWSYSVADPNQVSLVTSETFVRDTSPSPLVGSSTDARLGGAPLVWQKTWERSAGGAARHSVQDGVLRTNLSLPDAPATLHGIGQNQRVEFDFTLETQQFPWSTTDSTTIIAMGATTNHPLNSTASLQIKSWYEGKANIEVRSREGSPYTLPSLLPSQLNGHYVVELLEQSVVVSMPRMAPVTIPVTRVEREVSTGIRIGQGTFGQETFSTYDNLKISKIGF